MKSRRIRVIGRVQGVFFRNWTVEIADSLGLSGWVRNRSDGSVELLAAGEASALDALAERLHEGPSSARVERVEVEDADEIPAQGFRRAPTA